MSTLKQIEANRRNSLQSTGPKTIEGKAKVSRNAYVHGLRSRTLLLGEEDPAEFQQLADELAAEWQPQTCTERMLVEQIAIGYYKLAAMEESECDILTRESYQVRTLIADQLLIINRIAQYQTRIENSCLRAMRELRQLQKERRKAEATPAARVQDTPALESLDAEETPAICSRPVPPPVTQAPDPHRE